MIGRLDWIDDDMDRIASLGRRRSLAAVDPRSAQLTEMRFFGGLSNDEIGSVLRLSVRTVEREWRKARAFLLRELGGAERDPE